MVVPTLPHRHWNTDSNCILLITKQGFSQLNYSSMALDQRVELCHIIITNDAVHQQTLSSMAGLLGLEPRTVRLTAACTTIMLQASNKLCGRAC